LKLFRPRGITSELAGIVPPTVLAVAEKAIEEAMVHLNLVAYWIIRLRGDDAECAANRL
jgi:hypothetical protein